MIQLFSVPFVRHVERRLALVVHNVELAAQRDQEAGSAFVAPYARRVQWRVAIARGGI